MLKSWGHKLFPEQCQEGCYLPTAQAKRGASSQWGGLGQAPCALGLPFCRLHGKGRGSGAAVAVCTASLIGSLACPPGPHPAPQALQRRGHNVSRTDWSGVTQAISVSLEDGTLTGVSDPRKDGAPAGF